MKGASSVTGTRAYLSARDWGLLIQRWEVWLDMTSLRSLHGAQVILLAEIVKGVSLLLSKKWSKICLGLQRHFALGDSCHREGRGPCEVQSKRTESRSGHGQSQRIRAASCNRLRAWGGLQRDNEIWGIFFFLIQVIKLKNERSVCSFSNISCLNEDFQGSSGM